jgi:GTPase SAR1 family protein
MGICTSDLNNDPNARVEKQRNGDLGSAMQNNKNKWENLQKLLLLGAGESGKSTLFKQMVQIYGTDEQKQESEDEIMGYVNLIAGNVATNSLVLAEACANHVMPETPEAVEALDWIETKMTDDLVITPEIAQTLHTFWTDPGVQKTYDLRSNFQLNDSAAYFFNKIQEIGEPGWRPSHDDRIRTRVRTTGIVEHNFEIDGNPFRMFDVGGQRNERKKWIHCFEGVTAVLFVAAISEFDQVLFEDESTNRMTEALNLFFDICNSKWFEKTSIVLFLNKDDLFREKILTKNISDSTCPELRLFSGDNRSYEETTEFLKQLFVERSARDDQLYTYLTCATNKDNVQIVFDTVKEIIITISLRDAGLA